MKLTKGTGRRSIRKISESPTKILNQAKKIASVGTMKAACKLYGNTRGRMLYRQAKGLGGAVR